MPVAVSSAGSRTSTRIGCGVCVGEDDSVGREDVICVIFIVFVSWGFSLEKRKSIDRKIDRVLVVDVE